MIPFLAVECEGIGSLVVHEGSRVGMLGASGAGKTSVLRALLGLDRRAVARLYGEVVGRKVLQEQVGWVPQGDGVFLDQTVFDNVARPPHVTRRPSRETALDVLDLLALAHLADTPVDRLSLPSRRRVALARALAGERPLLVVDGALDATLWPLLPLVLEHATHLKAVLIAGCSADDWAWNADTVVLVDGGAVVAQGPLAELVGRSDAAVKGVLAWVMV